MAFRVVDRTIAFAMFLALLGFFAVKQRCDLGVFAVIPPPDQSMTPLTTLPSETWICHLTRTLERLEGRRIEPVSSSSPGAR